jgi:YhcH/YjgK/YiaL family protein
MIFGNIRHAETMFAWLPAPLRTALRYLQSTDVGALAPGRYDLQGRDIYVQVNHLTTKPLAETRPEIHRAYIDVQFLASGRERIGVADDTGHNEVAEDALAERDVLFYRAAEGETMLEMVPGNFAILFPADVHRPGCQADGPLAIRKAIVKVRVSLLG